MLLIILVTLLLPALKFLPLACVASVLLYVSFRMLEFDWLARIYQQSRRQFVVVVFVAAVCVMEDATTGITLGWIVSMLSACVSLSKGTTKVMVRQGSSIISTFYTDIVLTDKVMPPFIFNTRVKMNSLHAVQERLVFDPARAPHLNAQSIKIRTANLKRDDTDSWTSVRELGVPTRDIFYKLIVHYAIQGQLSFMTALTHVKRLSNVQSDVVLIDLTDTTGVDLDGQVQKSLVLFLVSCIPYFTRI